MPSPAQEFLRQAIEKSSDPALRAKLRKNIGSYDAAVQIGRKRCVNWEAARLHNQNVKWEAINHLERYLLQFEENVTARGGRVFWAETAQQARDYICNLAQQRGVTSVVKAKSMATEEIHLNHALEQSGIEAVETDLGEFIVQMRGEAPYHIVTPAMHLSRQEVAQTFRQKLGAIDTDDPQQLVAMARRALRKKFFSAGMGISGANFLVADAGMIAITTNEGNADLSVTLPKIHVALAGIEKVIPRLQDLAWLWPSLATAGTGQGITVYNTLVGPRQAGEHDGPEEFHVVLLDNGRSELLADAEQRDVLHCIRCGACLNACPVYKTIGGHAYGTTYQGPIGSVLTPHLRGPQFDHLAYASSLCGACTSVCPVKIDLHHHLLHNRRNATHHPGKGAERVAFRMWSWAMRGPRRYRLAARAMRAGAGALRMLGLAGTRLDPARAWTQYRSAIEVPRKSFRQLWREHAGQ